MDNIMKSNLTTVEKMGSLQRFLIVHSYIYYNKDGNIISDKEYDETAKYLADWKEREPDTWAKSEYAHNFGDDYNGSTGMGIFESLTEKQQKIILGIVAFAPGISTVKQEEKPKNKRKGKKKNG